MVARTGRLPRRVGSDVEPGSIRQSANPYSIDSVLRIVHTLLLARAGRFSLHASSAVRNGRAFLFAGVSGAGKTTIARLAPPDAMLLTDEISYVTHEGDRLLRLRHAICRRAGQTGRKCERAHRRAVFAGQRTGKPDRTGRAGGSRPACSRTFCFSPRIQNWLSWFSMPLAISSAACRFTG